MRITAPRLSSSLLAAWTGVLIAVATASAAPAGDIARDLTNAAFPEELSCEAIRAASEAPLDPRPDGSGIPDTVRPASNGAAQRWQLRRLGLSTGVTGYGADDLYDGDPGAPGLFDLARYFPGLNEPISPIMTRVERLPSGTGDESQSIERLVFGGACSERLGETYLAHPEPERPLTFKSREVAPGCLMTAGFADGAEPLTQADIDDLKARNGGRLPFEMRPGDLAYTRLLLVAFDDQALSRTGSPTACQGFLRELRPEVQADRAGPFWRALKDNGLIDFSSFEQLDLAVVGEGYVGTKAP